MTYKTIGGALKKSRGYITFRDILNGCFYHQDKGHTALIIKEDIKIDSLVELIGGRGYDYKTLINNYLVYKKPSCGIFERIIYQGERWSYIAGQDYIGELNTVRKILRG